MPEEQVEGVPEELDAWLTRRAAETDRDPAEVLSRAVATYRLLSEYEDETGDPTDGEQPDAATLPDRLAAIEADIADLSARHERHESTTGEDVADLRERVVQVLQIAEEKADEDHDHAELEAELDEVEAAVAEVEQSLSATESAIERLDDRVDGGFENFEAILDDLVSTVDETEGKLDSLAGAVVSLRGRTSDLEAANARRTAAEDLQAEANREGVGVADCEECGEAVDIGLLSKPRCPHCDSVFTDLTPGRRFFGRSVLHVGDPPALEGEVFDWPDSDEVFDDG